MSLIYKLIGPIDLVLPSTANIHKSHTIFVQRPLAANSHGTLSFLVLLNHKVKLYRYMSKVPDFNSNKTIILEMLNQ